MIVYSTFLTLYLVTQNLSVSKSYVISTWEEPIKKFETVKNPARDLVIQLF